MKAGRPLGANVVGYLEAESGTGEIARSVIASLRAAQIPHSVIVNHLSSSRQNAWRSRTRVSRLYDVNIICANADELPRIASRITPLMRGRHNIAVWAWEVDRFPPPMAASALLVEEVWAISQFAADAIGDSIEQAVHVFPLPLVPKANDKRDMPIAGIPLSFTFLFCFDYLSVFERKNPLAVVRAFCRAFPQPGAGATLVLKSVNGHRFPHQHALLQQAAAGRDDIMVIDRYLTSLEQSSLVQRCNVYVSLHRSEGYGLTMAEAMYLGKPVIATGYSGNLEFMNASNSWLVPYDLVPVPEGCDPYPRNAHWAEPSIEAAASAMREIHEGSDRVRERASLGREAIRRLHSPEARDPFLRARLKAASDALMARTVSGPHRRTPSFRLPARPLAQAMVWALERNLETTSPFFVARTPKTMYRALRGAASRIVRRRIGYDELVARLNAVEAELSAEPFRADPDALMIEGRTGKVTLGFDDSRASKDDVQSYAEFEDIFRGSEDMIRERLRWYVPFLLGLDPVVDIGCGRGELLDVAAENGIVAIGVDADAGMVRRAGSRGHSVAHGDAIEYLEGVAEGSLGAIFSAQVIEHLAPDDLRRLLVAGERALRPGGILIAETVNPHSPMAAKTFWLDYTHQHPIFPEALLFLCRDAGFARGEVVFPNGTGDFQRDRRYEGEYAVVATKQQSHAA